MSQYTINIGALPNDGTGDPLRTAFNETNLNFNQVFAAGPVLSNIQIANNTILTTNTNGNLVLAPNGTGVVQSNVSIVPNLANLRNLGSSTQRWSTVYTQYLNATQINLTGDLTVAGNLTVSGNIIQLGNIVTDSLTIQLANTATTPNAAGGAGITVGANDDIATLLYRANGNVWTTNIGLRVSGQANVTALSVNQTANTWVIAGNSIVAPTGATWVSTPGFQDEYITSAVNGYINLTSLYSNGNTASQIHLEHGLAQIVVDNGVENIWEFDSSGNLTLPGNTFAVNYANGEPVSLGVSSTYGNANVAVFMADYGSNTISTVGNITSNYYFGNAAVLAGQNTRGEHSANLGSAGFTELGSNVIVQVTGNANSYTQINFQNINSGNRATTDYIATAAFGTDSTFFVDMGIASNSYDQNNPDNSLGDSLYPQDSYLYSQGGNNAGGSGGNLVVGSNEPGGVVRVIADGSDIGNIVATFSNVGIDVTGNIVPVTSNVYSLGNATNQWSDLYVSNATIYMNNVPIGLTSGNVLTVDGSDVVTTSANGQANIGNLDISGTAISIAAGSPETYINISSSAEGWAYVQVPTDATANVYNTRIHNDAGNIEFGTGDYSTGSTNYIWTLGNDGNLTVPGAVTSVNGINLYAGDAATITSNNTGATNTWTFDETGNLNLPAGGNIVGQTANNNGYLTWVGNSSGDGYGYTTLELHPDNTISGDGYLIIDPTAPNHIHIRAGGAQDNSSSQLYLGGENSYFMVENGSNPNVYVQSNSNQWKFDTTGVLTLPGEGTIQSLNDTVNLRSLNTTTGNANSVYLGSSGGLGFFDQEIGGNWLEIFRSGTEPEIRVPVGLGNLNIQTASGNTPYNWVFDDTGNLSTPGNIDVVGNAASTSKTTGALTVAGGLGVAGTAYTNRSVVQGAYGNIILNEFTGIYNQKDLGTSLIQTTTNALSAGVGMQVSGAAGNGSQIYSTGTMDIKVGVTVRAEDTPSGGTVIASVASTGVTVTGVVSATGNITGGNITMSGGNIVGANVVTANIVNSDVSTDISNVTINSYTFVPQLWFKGALSAAQNVTTLTDTVTIWNNNSDPLGWGNVTTGHILPNKAGWYEVTSRVQFNTNAAANSQIQLNHQIAVNDISLAISQLPNLTANVPMTMITTAMVDLNGTTDYITTTSWSDIAGNAQQINGSTSSMLLVKWVST